MAQITKDMWETRRTGAIDAINSLAASMLEMGQRTVDVQFLIEYRELMKELEYPYDEDISSQAQEE